MNSHQYGRIHKNLLGGGGAGEGLYTHRVAFGYPYTMLS